MITNILKQLTDGTVILCKPESLEKILSEVEILDERDTHFSDMIRIVKSGDEILIQEKTSKGEIVLRRMTSRAAATDFVTDRLQTYENMWNGCGCKVNYYE